MISLLKIYAPCSETKSQPFLFDGIENITPFFLITTDTKRNHVAISHYDKYFVAEVFNNVFGKLNFGIHVLRAPTQWMYMSKLCTSMQTRHSPVAHSVFAVESRTQCCYNNIGYVVSLTKLGSFYPSRDDKSADSLRADGKTKEKNGRVFAVFDTIYVFRGHSFITYAQISGFQTPPPVRTDYDVTMTTIHWRTHGA